MSAFTWGTTLSGDWGVATNWNPPSVPDGNTVTAVLPGAPGNYEVTIAGGENEIVNAITLGDLSGAHVGPTLGIAGTLTFAGSGPGMAFLSGRMTIASTGLLDGFGSLGTLQGGGPLVLVNDGRLAGDAGSDEFLAVLVGFTNNGTVLADNGSVGIEGSTGLTNLSGNTLAGGTWIAQGPTAGAFNQIIFGVNFNAVIAVDAANIVLDGVATDIDGYSGGNFQPIEQQLQTIASNGTLQLLGDRGYATANVLTNAGSLIFQGGALDTDGLTVASSGTLDGFGVIDGGVANDGAMVARGGALDVESTASGSGVYGATSGSTLILHGATATNLNNQGTVYNASGLLDVTGALGGDGSLVVQSGATIEFFSATVQDVGFSGSDATLKLDNFAGYLGTLVGFARNDTLVLAGTSATNAFISDGSLVVMDNGTTVDAIPVAGSYAPDANFNVSDTGGDAIVTNTGGAPLQQDFAFSVILNDPDDLGGAQDATIVQDLSAAAADWAQYLTGHTTLRIQLNIVATANGSELANAGPTLDIPTGETLDGRSLDTPSSIIALTTGNYVPGTSSDITVNLPVSNLGSIYVNPSPTPQPSGTVPADEYDLVTVFRHELAHGFGFGGLTTSNGDLGSQETLFDHYIQNVAGTIAFTGPNAEVAYGVLLGTDIATPVPLTTLSNGEAFAHFANSPSDPDATDLMSGLGLPPGTQRDISAMDLAVLTDVGDPVTAVVCYARGTRIATPRGEIAIEDLAVGDMAVTAAGLHRSIVWLGRRCIDCQRHPRPELVRPVRIAADAFAPGMPHRDLLVSPQHALFVDGVLIPAKYLINGSTIAQLAVRAIEYFHIELPRHDLLLAERMPAESYLECGDRARFDNGGRMVVLHPDFAGRVWESGGCAPLKLVGPEVDAVRRRLADRTVAVGARRGNAA